MTKNRGLLIEEQINPKDYRFGLVTGLSTEVLNPSRNWSNWIPLYEPQSRTGWDSQSCVTFSALNCLEMLYFRQFGIERNFSDRFTAVASETTTRGNYLSKVAETIRTVGLVDEQDYPFSDDIKDFWEFHKKPLPDELFIKADKFLDQFKVGWEWAGASQATIRAALQFSPLSVTVEVGNSVNNKGYYVNHDIIQYGHAIALYAITDDHYKCYDHYTNKFKNYDILYNFGAVMRWSLENKKPMKNPLNLLNNTLVQCVEGKGEIGLYLDDKIIVDDLAKILATWIIRNNGAISRVKAITLDNWNKYDKTNLKGEMIRES